MGEGKLDIKVHPTAIVSDRAEIGEGTVIWAYAQVMDGAKIGKNCMIGNGVYVDRNVRIGDNVKVHNKASIYNGTIIEDDVFIGPHACFTNDKHPAFDKTRDMKGVSWRVGKGTSIGANVTVLPDVNIGSNSLIGAGSVVTKDIPDGSICYGNPAGVKGYVNG
ncbi:MAG: acyltransferase [Candidatus Omnitrophota bacterium]|jgi:acetyltransferase-like isoleucine patch superfamily enzyme